MAVLPLITLLAALLSDSALCSCPIPGLQVTSGFRLGREKEMRLRGGMGDVGGVKDVQADLLNAAHAGKLGDVIEALESGADPNQFCDNAENMLEPNALQYACFQGHVKVVEKLVEKGANVNLANKRGYTALHFAALMGHLDTCKALVKLGADMNATDTFGDRPIDRAEQAEKHDTVKWLQAQMDSLKLGQTESAERDTVNQELVDDMEKMLQDEDFIPAYMKGEDGQILPEYSSVARLIAAKKALMGEDGKDMDFESIQKIVDETMQEVDKVDPDAEEFQQPT